MARDNERNTTYGVPVGKDPPRSLQSIPYSEKRELHRNLTSAPWAGGRERFIGYNEPWRRGDQEFGGLEALYNKPIDFDYDALKRNTLANRQRVGWVGNESSPGNYIPASTAESMGYFNDPSAPGKTYFETNPEFKTFFPYDPYYAGLEALKEWEKTGKGMYGSGDLNQYLGLYTPSTWEINREKNMADAIGLNTSPEAAERWESLYGSVEKGVRDTALHEMLHHYTQSPSAGTRQGTTLMEEYPQTGHGGSKDPWHTEISMGAPMWNPAAPAGDEWAGLTKDDFQIRDQWMRLHRLSKKRYLNEYNRGGLVSLVL